MPTKRQAYGERRRSGARGSQPTINLLDLLILCASERVLRNEKSLPGTSERVLRSAGYLPGSPVGLVTLPGRLPGSPVRWVTLPGRLPGSPAGMLDVVWSVTGNSEG